MSSIWIIIFGLVLAGIAVNKFLSHRRNALYNSKIPGPLFAALSDIPFSYHIMVGDHPKWIARLHAKYGPVVRISPNELSFNTPSSWRDIYGFRKGHGVFTKSFAYDAAAFTGESRSIVNERDPAKHAKMRKLIAPAFSERALRDQYLLIDKVTERFISEIGKRAERGEAVDLEKWFSMTTFETITDLALGENFHSLEAGKKHPWSMFFMNGARAMGDGIAVMRFPWLMKLLLAMPPPTMKAMIRELRAHEEFTTELVKKRRNNPVDRPDIIGRILQAEDPNESFSTAFVAAQLSDCVIAGTDTTATSMSTANFYLTRNPEAMRKLQAEIRGTFNRYDEINPASTAKLEYLNAVLQEAMRILPPVSWAPSREVPPGGDTVDGHFLPEGVRVSTSYFAAARSPDNFKDPEEFHPERWLDGSRSAGDKLDASQPFNLGSRVCIGKQLALVEMRLIMAKLHFKYDLTAMDHTLDWVKDSKLRLLWSKPPLMTIVKERPDVGL
ncbi:benzoate 4-monooxygenase cytochrome P450 [Apodospora peruviana]|uniref:Benzoate 4-monooxygenase cytochrome P450 n=1 Tax=Apodospora peruviana TaxID=516989 RepID=A0AAE0HZJ0_9PEZI|nr:benzoate 4-monooxygenase cytochrome P450 [Apodospora peruviana]